MSYLKLCPQLFLELPTGSVEWRFCCRSEYIVLFPTELLVQPIMTTVNDPFYSTSRLV